MLNLGEDVLRAYLRVNRPPLSVTAQPQPYCILCCNVAEEAKVPET
jgi:hypothetical protein